MFPRFSKEEGRLDDLSELYLQTIKQTQIVAFPALVAYALCSYH